MGKAYKFISTREKLMKVLFVLSSAFCVFALLVVFIFLLGRGVPAISKIGFFKFLFGQRWITDEGSEAYGILPMLLGTLYVTALSIVAGGLLGLFTALMLYKFCHKKISAVIKQVINILAGVPSVIFGLFGILFVVPWLRFFSGDTGLGILAASIILSIMVLPTIVSVSLDALNAVPKTYYEAALALGATKERAVFRVMLPAAKSGIFAAFVLAIGRCIGETMAVAMVIGGAKAMPNSLFQAVSTITSAIALDSGEARGFTLEALIACGVVLLVFAFLLNLAFSLLKSKGEKSLKSKKRKAKGKANGEIENESS